MFARQPLEVVSDTIAHSFGRAFLVGLLGQILLLPTFGMLVVGLILSVAGILLLPFAVVVYGLLVVVAILGGFLAVAHAMGERYTRRQLAMGAAIMSANSYRYVAVGLIGVTALWAVWVLFGWVPVAGTLVFATALLVTWLLATVGFGAALLSRAGFREEFAGRLLPAEALTDEYLWATPQFGVPAQKRPGSRTPPPLR
jgi:GNAT superfamily N-acetyltransferase